jgi:hypothetical protein
MIAAPGLLLLVFLTLAAAPTGVADRAADRDGPVCREQTLWSDLDRDGVPERYDLAGFRLTVSVNGRTLWQSPSDWQVAQFVLADSTNDGAADLNMVVWKRGSFGAYRPFWFEGEDDEYCNHLYVFDLQGGHMKPVWMSSGLAAPIDSLNIRDVDGDGRDELEVCEREVHSSANSSGPAGPTIWRWDVWGFTRVK